MAWLEDVEINTSEWLVTSGSFPIDGKSLQLLARLSRVEARCRVRKAGGSAPVVGEEGGPKSTDGEQAVQSESAKRGGCYGLGESTCDGWGLSTCVGEASI